MSDFIREYKEAFKRDSRISFRCWIIFALKSALVFMLLCLAYTLIQYAVLLGTPLYEYVTVSEIQLSSSVGIIISLLVSFVPCTLYLIRMIIR